jgi:hypothetical protein
LKKNFASEKDRLNYHIDKIVSDRNTYLEKIPKEQQILNQHILKPSKSFEKLEQKREYELMQKKRKKNVESK